MKKHWPERKTKAIHTVSGDGHDAEPLRQDGVSLTVLRQPRTQHGHTAGFSEAVRRGNKDHVGSKSDLSLR